MIVGHEKIINFLDRSIEKDKIFGAYLFCGPAHLGKFSLALEFAEKITGGKGQKINPDIIIISPETEPASTRSPRFGEAGGDRLSMRGGEKDGKIRKKDIKIEKIRELEHALNLSAYFGKYKVAIVDEADRLTNASQNALLKTLEEPPQKTAIILVAEKPDKIIPTIKSRCVVKKFNLVEESQIDAIIGKNIDAEDIKFWSLNRPGLAVNLQKEKEKLEKRKKSRRDLEKMFSANLSEKFSFCDDLSKNSSEMMEELDFWIVLLRQNIFGNCRSNWFDQEKSLQLIQKIEESLKIINKTNANPKLVLENLALEMQ